MKTSVKRMGLRIGLLCLSLLVNVNSFAAQPTDELERGFLTPPDSAKPQAWWHWMNGNITREGITADLEAMKRVGIHGAEIFNVYEGIPDGPAPFMSPQWLELFRFAAEEADRLGMELCFHNCAGWSSSGGPWIKPEFAMQTVVSSETQVRGGTRFEASLQQPPTKFGYYRDIAVLAFPTPLNGQRIDKLAPKAFSGADYEFGMQPATNPIPASAVIPQSKIIDLTKNLSAEGKLSWEIPAGNWTILRMGYTPRGEENHPAPAAGRGLECDKLSREAMDAHWEGGIAPILKKLGPLAGKSLNNCLIDSYEVGCNNWSPAFRSEFIKRRGYDPVVYLPVLSGRYVESGELTERFLWDLRRTVGDLFSDNYFGYFCDLCKSNGLMSSLEPYDGPFEGLQVAAKANIVMGEFWAGGGESSWVKLAASVAHTHGMTIVGAESFTAAPDKGKWLNHPGSLKSLGDLTWCTGLNRFIFHCYAHQPWFDKAPGMTMGQWGTHFGRTTTWWEQSRDWMSYISRSQFLLQQGRCVADVLYFGGEGAPNGGVYRPELKARGYDYDAIGTDLIYALTVKDHLIYTPVGGSYRMLVLPETRWMTPALAKKVGELAKAGATILGPKPEQSPSLSGFPYCDAELAAVANEVWGSTQGEHVVGNGRVISDRSVEKVLSEMRLQPDFAALSPESGLLFIHRVVVGADLYFVSNQQVQPQTVECAFRVTGREPELWDAQTGKIVTAPLWHVQDGRTIVTLSLEQAGSVFVVFRKTAAPTADPIIKVAREMAPPALRTLPKLAITRALYGATSMEKLGIVDVTTKLAVRIQDGQLHASDFNSLGGDPAPGVVKELRVDYELDGQPHAISIAENRALVLSAATGSGTLRIIRAVYGKFPVTIKQLKELPPLRTIDVTERVAAQIHNNMIGVQVNNELAGSDPTLLLPKELFVEFTVDGIARSVVVPEQQNLRIPEEAWNLLPPEPRMTLNQGQLTLVTPVPGHVICTTASGVQTMATVDFVPKAIELGGDWDVTFPAGLGAPSRATFEKLISWPARPEPGIKYFSGTATYRKVFTIPTANIEPEGLLELDLGNVLVIAEVRLNGKDLGILWKSPYRVNLGTAAKTGRNELEVRVTNLWPNRMIGDEQYDDDCEWNGDTLKRWPDWMMKGTPRPSTNRITFATWKHWHKDSQLQPSGLLGPVLIRTYVSAPVK